jgi:hypothetical protein
MNAWGQLRRTSRKSGTYNRNVYRVFRLAKRQAEPPFFEVKNHAFFFDRNPGLFRFAAELFVPAGASEPIPNQLLSILSWDAVARCTSAHPACIHDLM